MKKILASIALLVVPAIASAQPSGADLMALGMPSQMAKYFVDNGVALSVLTNNAYLKSANAAGNANINVLKVDGTDDTVLNADSGDVIKLAVAATPHVQVDAAGITMVQSAAGLVYSVAAATPATDLTPSASNLVKPVTIVVTAGPTNQAVALPASPTDGEERTIVNLSANPLVVAALGTPGMNFPVTPGPRRLSVATRVEVTCKYISAAASWGCYPKTAYPTPAS